MKYNNTNRNHPTGVGGDTNDGNNTNKSNFRATNNAM